MGWLLKDWFSLAGFSEKMIRRAGVLFIIRILLLTSQLLHIDRGMPSLDNLDGESYKGRNQDRSQTAITTQQSVLLVVYINSRYLAND